MASFKEKLEEKQESYAYYQGATACMEGRAMNTSPYERGSPPDSDWVDGYLDAMFLRKL
jgi:ribosome modulation factor